MAEQKPQIKVKEMSEPPKKSFFAKDMSEVGSYLWKDRIIPGLKKFVYDIFTNGLHMSLFGNGAANQSSQGYQYVSPYQGVAYGSMYKNQAPKPAQAPQSNGLGYDRFLFEERGDAEKALVQLQDIINEFGMTRVSDLYDILQKTPPTPEAHNYGWESVVDAVVVPCADGFTIKFPKAKFLNK